MKKGLTEVVFILDRSGSMAGLESDTIGGYNAMMEKQKKEEGEALVSTVLFDDKCEVLHDRVLLDTMKPITEKDYFVRGATALLDAIGGAIRHIGNVHKYAREEDRPEHTIFIITTDGMENSSRRYSYDKIRKMVERQQKKYGWEFLFLGANMDAISEARRFGIRAEHATNFVSDEEGTRINYMAMSQAVSTVRCSAPNASTLDGTWKQEVEADYKKRAEKKSNCYGGNHGV